MNFFVYEISLKLIELSIKIWNTRKQFMIFFIMWNRGQNNTESISVVRFTSVYSSLHLQLDVCRIKTTQAINFNKTARIPPH